VDPPLSVTNTSRRLASGATTLTGAPGSVVTQPGTSDHRAHSAVGFHPVHLIRRGGHR
jgi:hypothetical protein